MHTVVTRDIDKVVKLRLSPAGPIMTLERDPWAWGQSVQNQQDKASLPRLRALISETLHEFLENRDSGGSTTRASNKCHL